MIRMSGIVARFGSLCLFMLAMPAAALACDPSQYEKNGKLIDQTVLSLKISTDGKWRECKHHSERISGLLPLGIEQNNPGWDCEGIVLSIFSINAERDLPSAYGAYIFTRDMKTTYALIPVKRGEWEDLARCTLTKKVISPGNKKSYDFEEGLYANEKFQHIDEYEILNSSKTLILKRVVDRYQPVAEIGF